MTDEATGKPTENRVANYPDDDLPLSTAILEAIEDHKNEDLRESDFVLYDDINPDAIDNLFREDSTARTAVEFNTDDVTVTLRGNGTVEVRVSDRDE